MSAQNQMKNGKCSANWAIGAHAELCSKLEKLSIFIQISLNKALKSIFYQFPPTSANFDLCQVDPFEKMQIFC